MFYTGTPNWMRILFMFTTMTIAVPTGVKVFAWVATLWRGKLRLTTPMLFCLGGLVNFIFAGITGVMLGTVPIDIHVGNTYFVVAHFHYVIFNAIVLGCLPLFITGSQVHRPYVLRGLGQAHFALTFIGCTLNWLPLHWAGLLGMPRRVASYDPEFAIWNVIASVGAFLLGVAAIPFILNMVSSYPRPKAPPNPGARSVWSGLPSPPPAENFEDDVPTVLNNPYGYGLDQPQVADEAFYVRRAQEA